MNKTSFPQIHGNLGAYTLKEYMNNLGYTKEALEVHKKTKTLNNTQNLFAPEPSEEPVFKLKHKRNTSEV